MDNKKIGLFLKDLRIKQGLSQKGIASICNVSHQAVSKWEKGDSIPDLSSLLSLSNYYHITINEILNASIDESRGIHKPFNNRNKEIIKITMSLFVMFVSFLPFFKDTNGSVFNGFELLGNVEFGLGILTYILMMAYLVFQITFSIFTMLRVISFSRSNLYLNRGVTVIMVVFIWFTLALSEFYSYPYLAFLVYLISIYVVNTRVLRVMDLKTEYKKLTPKYEPYVYILFYVILLTTFPIYLIVFKELRGVIEILSIIFIALGIITFVIGYSYRNKNLKLASILKHITVSLYRIVYVLLFYISYADSIFFDFSNSQFSGVMVVIVYIAYELIIYSKYNESLKQLDDVVPLFQ